MSTQNQAGLPYLSAPAVWSRILLIASLFFPMVTALAGAASYIGKTTSIMIAAPFFLGAIAGATWGCCAGCVAIVISLFGCGWRSLLFLPALALHVAGALLAYRIYGPR